MASKKKVVDTGLEDILLIYDFVPENIEYYVIPGNISEQYESWLNEAHNKIVNCCDENDGMKFLSAAICGKNRLCDIEYLGPEWQQYGGVFAEFKVDGTKPITRRIRKVVYSGFGL